VIPRRCPVKSFLSFQRRLRNDIQHKCLRPATEVAGYFQWSLRDLFGMTAQRTDLEPPEEVRENIFPKRRILRLAQDLGGSKPKELLYGFTATRFNVQAVGDGGLREQKGLTKRGGVVKEICCMSAPETMLISWSTPALSPT